MFFKNRVVSIGDNDFVLEIGPGSDPHPRSDCFLEKSFTTEDEGFQQRGFANQAPINKPLSYYDGVDFPFKNDQFDYIICSHVLEHVPLSDISDFMSELQRVAKKGYIEFPNILYELINHQDVHKWYMWYKDGTIYFLDKNKLRNNSFFDFYRDFFYKNELSPLFSRHENIFFFGFEWSQKIEYKVCESFQELVDLIDFETIGRLLDENKKSSASVPAQRSINKAKVRCKKILNKLSNIRLSSMLSRLKNITCLHKKNITKSAILEPRNNIKIHPTAEIKDYCIIRSYENPVLIGEFSQLNPFCVIYGGSGVIVGKNVMIGPHTVIAAGSHEYRNLDVPMRHAGSFNSGPIVISDDVWIGANCTITDGVLIGQGAVVGANSVVTKNVDPYDIVAGCPAKKISSREKYRKAY